MFDGLKDMGKLLKQAKEMKSKMKEVQEELKTLMCSGSSDGVEVTVSGELVCEGILINDETLLSDKSRLQNAMKAAFNIASGKAKEAATAKLSAVSGDMNLNLPGM